ncbi:nuclear transport factor 2 family protein (plasmid) [Bradyrhizobium sp. 186]|uniref:nuclear transport factor 2 family protein n=1 Tax=Bradyrhizobium sp. 186 TaxID=2782654 RepID=UPI002001A423|nr:nuclear transport factor 2 family protein [Bradyrhizobium sp. 186]UPK40996.1 nuclear transport factor 2 family protein [Bradyrhizobium sp. 186]
MNKNDDVKAITRKFFAAYDAHDVDGMLALCADGAQGRYLPYGKKSLMPIRGGLEQIWRGLLGAVPDFGVKVDEMIQAEGSIIVVQAQLGGAMPADVPGLVTKGKSDRIAHAYIIRYNADGKITRLDCYWDNTSINAIKASAL